MLVLLKRAVRSVAAFVRVALHAVFSQGDRNPYSQGEKGLIGSFVRSKSVYWTGRTPLPRHRGNNGSEL
eukprot:scaffold35904_cov34-Prasinocladus_malaysianus.AAC.1